MAEEKSAGKPGGERLQAAAIGLDKNASQVLETAAKEWLERHRAGKKQ